MENKGLMLSMIFEAESANYGEGVGNIASLKKMARGAGEQYTYISRQAIRYNIIQQLGEKNTPTRVEKDVVQFAPDATIKDYPEIDFFGYMKTEKGADSKIRSAVVRLSNAISLETFKGDLDFLTNKGLAERTTGMKGMNIAQAEIHRSYYRYTITVDLEQIGIDDEIELAKEEKARRVNKLLDTIALLYRDIRGRREDLKPLFAIGGVYDVKNPIFQNILEVKENKIVIEAIKDVMFDSIEKDTLCGLIKGKFGNDEEIIKELGAVSMPELFKKLKVKVSEYYESN
ncbi:type I-B CRISPR-associated protein Cas7/Cst2/DevR [Candidatus Galacturonibacter soehngenii]|uniref:Type I-B CRISPR-associated protein Cas7/Cst2/DevR n=1 Tax=Candidatus Galacturonatibacter soehngenii TaxID=2307010 RepID=A0A7V7UHN5_9FIRM|nr:type I-B CRISPR-associated protein Cas7/Cst2/DevR [Candidatus Galacturonibacter soehngenii]KAB1440158.1 type I-B CRISPR-associated protein Cas7/Cst2/DevR [Candidatus Galacturonibacter soehngenii]MBA4685999.1 type I-B CRISPR-associated protein Cas7/Cst2/DevR [Candidatus Galacturonibacter soehngenii]